MTKKLLIWIIVPLILSLSVFSCRGKEKQAAGRTYTVGICVAQENELTRAMHRAIDERAPSEDANILWASAEQNEAAQERILKDFYTGGARGIVLEPVNQYTAGALIDDAAIHGIPVIGIGDIVETQHLKAIVRPDLASAGENLVQYVLGRQRRRGVVVVLMREISDSTETSLVRSIITNLRENGSGYRVFGFSTDSAVARRAMNSILFSPSPPSAVIATRYIYGAIAADLFRLGLVSPRPVLACYSGEQITKDAFQNGTIEIVVDPDPALIGTTALSSIIRLMKGLPPEIKSRETRGRQQSVPIIETPVKVLRNGGTAALQNRTQ